MTAKATGKAHGYDAERAVRLGKSVLGCLLEAPALRADFGAHRARDELRRVVQLRRQALHLDPLQAVESQHRHHLMGEGAAGNQQQGRFAGHEAAAALRRLGAWRRSAMSFLAVSTAIAASRQ